MNFGQTLALVLILDGLWINFYFKHKFFPMIEAIQSQPMSVNPIYFIVAYLILTTLIYVIIPKCNSILEAFMLGFLIYAVYDSTNLATLKGWDIGNAIMDSVWGGLLVAIIYFAANYKTILSSATSSTTA